jgi:hypothetical protein
MMGSRGERGAPDSHGTRGLPVDGKHVGEVWFDRPVIILSAPRSGSTLLFEALARAPGVYTIGKESHPVIEGHAGLSTRKRGYASNRLLASDAGGGVANSLRFDFACRLRDRHGHPPPPGPVRFLEKTPKNILRVSFLRAVFPDAHFVVLLRDPRAVLSSMMEAWYSGHFVTYRDLPGWRSSLPWSLLLVDDWAQVNGRPLEEIVAHQWTRGMSVLLDDLETLPRSAWTALRYEDLLADPQARIERLCAYAGLGWDQDVQQLPPSRMTVSAPKADKWKRDAEAIARVMPLVEPVHARAERVLGLGAD